MRTLLIGLALTLILALSSFAQTVPSSGTFGLGVSLSGIPTQAGSIASISNELSGSYWVSSNIVLIGGLGLTSISAGATTTMFSISAGMLYHLNKQQLSPLFGGSLYVGVTSPAQGSSTTTFGFIFGAGAEYYFSKHFGIIAFEGFQFNTTNSSPSTTVIGFASRMGLNWYF
jgi:hypothetical protein